MHLLEQMADLERKDREREEQAAKARDQESEESENNRRLNIEKEFIDDDVRTRRAINKMIENPNVGEMTAVLKVVEGKLI